MWLPVRPDGQFQHHAQLDRLQYELLSRLRPLEPGSARPAFAGRRRVWRLQQSQRGDLQRKHNGRQFRFHKRMVQARIQLAGERGCRAATDEPARGERLVRTIYGNFSVTDNLNLTPADFDPSASLYRSIPGCRRGQQLCGLNDQRINVATSNLVGFADDYVDKYAFGALKQSPQTEHFNGFDLSMAARLPRSGTFNAGWMSATRFRTRPSRPMAVSSTTRARTASSSTTGAVDERSVAMQVRHTLPTSVSHERFVRASMAGRDRVRRVQDLPGPLIVANRVYTSAEINAQPTGGLGRPLRMAANYRHPRTVRCMAIGCVSSIFVRQIVPPWRAFQLNVDLSPCA